ncbi:MAG: NUDIX hydrolase [Cryomorphaceae bacterium]
MGHQLDPEFEPYFKLGISVTLVLYGFEDGHLKIYIQKITKNPYAGAWALPGVLIKPHEGLETKSKEIAQEAIGNGDVFLEQLNAFGKIYRHPVGRVIDIAFYGLINMQSDIHDQRKDKESKWVSVKKVPELAYDHNEIFTLSRQRLKRRLINRPIGFKLLPKEFTLNEMQQLYEQILGHPLDKRNFRKKLTKLNVLIAKGHEKNDGPGRKPRLFMFNEDRYSHYMEQGF